MEEVRSTEPVEFKLKAFVASIGLKPFDGVGLTMTPPDNYDLVYRLGQNDFPGSKAAWVGEYKRPGAGSCERRDFAERAAAGKPDDPLPIACERCQP